MDYPDVNPLVPGGPGFGFHWFWTIGSFLFGLVLFAAFVIVVVLLVRYLLVATKAHQHYLDSHMPASSASTVPAPTSTPTSAPASPTPTAPAPTSPASTPDTSATTTPIADPTPPDVPVGSKTTRTRTPKPPAAR